MILRISLLFLLSVSQLGSSGQKYYSTRELENIAGGFGADSSLKIILPFIDITQIDSSASLFIALKCLNLKNSYLQLMYFTQVGQTLKNKMIVSNAVSTLKLYRHLPKNFADPAEKIEVVPDQIFNVFVFQNDSLIIPTLKTEFAFWEQSADSIKLLYPSVLKRFFQRFKGAPPSEKAFEDCKENAYKLAWTLNKMGDSGFPVERVKSIQRQLAAYPREFGMSIYNHQPYNFRSDTIELTRLYQSIAEIDFDNEPQFVKLKENLHGENCRTTIITNGLLGLYQIGCQWAPLAGRGKTIRLELLANNKLKVTEVAGWIS